MIGDNAGVTDALSRIRIVLVEPTHPGNIGAAARAMKTMGLRRLHLVAPREFPSAVATAFAAGADDLLVAAEVSATLPAAVAGCSLIIGTSARDRRIAWPAETPRDCAVRLMNMPPTTEAAVVFGREHAGLTNAEIEHCHMMMRIPTHPDFSSLNLAAAVQVIAYELRVAVERVADQKFPSAALHSPPVTLSMSSLHSPPVTSDDMERLYAHLEQTLIEVGFLDPDKPRRLMRRLRRLFSRTGVDEHEYNILRGFLAAVQERIRN